MEPAEWETPEGEVLICREQSATVKVPQLLKGAARPDVTEPEAGRPDDPDACLQFTVSAVSGERQAPPKTEDGRDTEEADPGLGMVYVRIHTGASLPPDEAVKHDPSACLADSGATRIIKPTGVSDDGAQAAAAADSMAGGGMAAPWQGLQNFQDSGQLHVRNTSDTQQKQQQQEQQQPGHVQPPSQGLPSTALANTAYQASAGNQMPPEASVSYINSSKVPDGAHIAGISSAGGSSSGSKTPMFVPPSAADLPVQAVLDELDDLLARSGRPLSAQVSSNTVAAGQPTTVSRSNSLGVLDRQLDAGGASHRSRRRSRSSRHGGDEGPPMPFGFRKRSSSQPASARVSGADGLQSDKDLKIRSHDMESSHEVRNEIRAHLQMITAGSTSGQQQQQQQIGVCLEDATVCMDSLPDRRGEDNMHQLAPAPLFGSERKQAQFSTDANNISCTASSPADDVTKPAAAAAADTGALLAAAGPYATASFKVQDSSCNAPAASHSASGRGSTSGSPQSRSPDRLAALYQRFLANPTARRSSNSSGGACSAGGRGQKRGAFGSSAGYASQLQAMRCSLPHSLSIEAADDEREEGLAARRCQSTSPRKGPRETPQRQAAAQVHHHQQQQPTLRQCASVCRSCGGPLSQDQLQPCAQTGAACQGSGSSNKGQEENQATSHVSLTNLMTGSVATSIALWGDNPHTGELQKPQSLMQQELQPQPQLWKSTVCADDLLQESSSAARRGDRDASSSGKAAAAKAGRGRPRDPVVRVAGHGGGTQDRYADRRNKPVSTSWSPVRQPRSPTAAGSPQPAGGSAAARRRAASSSPDKRAAAMRRSVQQPQRTVIDSNINTRNGVAVTSISFGQLLQETALQQALGNLQQEAARSGGGGNSHSRTSAWLNAAAADVGISSPVRILSGGETPKCDRGSGGRLSTADSSRAAMCNLKPVPEKGAAGVGSHNHNSKQPVGTGEPAAAADISLSLSCTAEQPLQDTVSAGCSDSSSTPVAAAVAASTALQELAQASSSRAGAENRASPSKNSSGRMSSSSARSYGSAAAMTESQRNKLRESGSFRSRESAASSAGSSSRAWRPGGTRSSKDDNKKLEAYETARRRAQQLQQQDQPASPTAAPLLSPGSSGKCLLGASSKPVSIGRRATSPELGYARRQAAAAASASPRKAGDPSTYASKRIASPRQHAGAGSRTAARNSSPKAAQTAAKPGLTKHASLSPGHLVSPERCQSPPLRSSSPAHAAAQDLWQALTGMPCPPALQPMLKRVQERQRLLQSYQQRMERNSGLVSLNVSPERARPGPKPPLLSRSYPSNETTTAQVEEAIKAAQAALHDKQEHLGHGRVPAAAWWASRCTEDSLLDGELEAIASAHELRPSGSMTGSCSSSQQATSSSKGDVVQQTGVQEPSGSNADAAESRAGSTQRSTQRSTQGLPAPAGIAQSAVTPGLATDSTNPIARHEPAPPADPEDAQSSQSPPGTGTATRLVDGTGGSVGHVEQPGTGSAQQPHHTRGQLATVSAPLATTPSTQASSTAATATAAVEADCVQSSTPSPEPATPVEGPATQPKSAVVETAAGAAASAAVPAPEDLSPTSASAVGTVPTASFSPAAAAMAAIATLPASPELLAARAGLAKFYARHRGHGAPQQRPVSSLEALLRVSQDAAPATRASSAEPMLTGALRAEQFRHRGQQHPTSAFAVAASTPAAGGRAASVAASHSSTHVAEVVSLARPASAAALLSGRTLLGSPRAHHRKRHATRSAGSSPVRGQLLGPAAAASSGTSCSGAEHSSIAAAAKAHGTKPGTTHHSHNHHHAGGSAFAAAAAAASPPGAEPWSGQRQRSPNGLTGEQLMALYRRHSAAEAAEVAAAAPTAAAARSSSGPLQLDALLRAYSALNKKNTSSSDKAAAVAALMGTFNGEVHAQPAPAGVHHKPTVDVGSCDARMHGLAARSTVEQQPARVRALSLTGDSAASALTANARADGSSLVHGSSPEPQQQQQQQQQAKEQKLHSSTVSAVEGTRLDVLGRSIALPDSPSAGGGGWCRDGPSAGGLWSGGCPSPSSNILQTLKADSLSSWHRKSPERQAAHATLLATPKHKHANSYAADLAALAAASSTHLAPSGPLGDRSHHKGEAPSQTAVAAVGTPSAAGAGASKSLQQGAAAVEGTVTMPSDSNSPVSKRSPPGGEQHTSGPGESTGLAGTTVMNGSMNAAPAAGPQQDQQHHPQQQGDEAQQSKAGTPKPLLMSETATGRFVLESIEAHDMTVAAAVAWLRAGLQCTTLLGPSPVPAAATASPQQRSASSAPKRRDHVRPCSPFACFGGNSRSMAVSSDDEATTQPAVELPASHQDHRSAAEQRQQMLHTQRGSSVAFEMDASNQLSMLVQQLPGMPPDRLQVIGVMLPGLLHTRPAWSSHSAASSTAESCFTSTGGTVGSSTDPSSGGGAGQQYALELITNGGRHIIELASDMDWSGLLVGLNAMFLLLEQGSPVAAEQLGALPMSNVAWSSAVRGVKV